MLEIEINTKVDGLNDLDNLISDVERYTEKTVKGLRDFLKEKVMNALQEVMNEKLIGGTTNDNEIGIYRNSNHIENIGTDGDFMIYNDATIPADLYNTLPFDTSGYPEGQFSIALAFEYGTGIQGTNGYGIEMGYTYNDLTNTKSESHQTYKDFWYMPKNVIGESGVKTEGYRGFEIYRFLKDKVEKEINNWVQEYYEKE